MLYILPNYSTGFNFKFFLFLDLYYFSKEAQSALQFTFSQERRISHVFQTASSNIWTRLVKYILLSTDCFVGLQLFSVVRHERRFKVGSKPA